MMEKPITATQVNLNDCNCISSQGFTPLHKQSGLIKRITDYVSLLEQLDTNDNDCVEEDLLIELEKSRRKLPRSHWKLTDYWIHLVTRRPIFTFKELMFALGHIKNKERKLEIIQKVLSANLNRYIIYFYNLTTNNEATEFKYLWDDNGTEQQSLLMAYKRLKKDIIKNNAKKIASPIKPNKEILANNAEIQNLEIIHSMENIDRDQGQLRHQTGLIIDNDLDKKFLTIQNVQKLFNISRTTIYNWIKQGKLIPSRMAGTKKLLFQLSHIEDKLITLEKYYLKKEKPTEIIRTFPSSKLIEKKQKK